MSQAAYNIAVIGQTGVGKSSLINYLFGKPVCKTGLGKPVTSNGFHKIEDELNGMPVHLYDSWGLEVGKEEQWKKELDVELKKRGIDKSPSEWFHSVFYCVAASGARIQDADIKIIKQFINDKYKVSIILTKADAINEDEEEEFKQEIKKAISSNVEIIAVCSESKKTRAATIEAFGREELIRQLLISAINSLIDRFPLHFKEKLEHLLNAWYIKCNEIIEEESKFFSPLASPEKVGEGIRKESELLQLKLEKEARQTCTETFGLYHNIFKTINTIADFESGSLDIENKATVGLKTFMKAAGLIGAASGTAGAVIILAASTFVYPFGIFLAPFGAWALWKKKDKLKETAKAEVVKQKKAFEEAIHSHANTIRKDLEKLKASL